MTPTQLPAHPAPPPPPGTECLVCFLLVPAERPYTYLIPPDYTQGGYLCELCTSEVRGLFVAIRERHASRAARIPAPAPKP